MTNSKTTRKALLSSALALTLCVAMLIATTFAWFTDTASTSVNKIQAGTLKVDIVKATDGTTSIKGGTLKWVQKTSDSGEATAVTEENKPLWEPGATFRTEGLKIKSTGNLALKYKLALTGIDGSAELLDVIKFYVVKEGTDGTFTEVDLDSFEGQLAAKDELSDAFYIQGHMDENAGNSYQGESLDGIGITVYATQLDSEFDSNGKTYDVDAAYSFVSAGAVAKVTTGTDNNTTTDTTVQSKTKVNGEAAVTLTVPTGVTMTEGASEVTVNVEEAEDSAANITLDVGQEQKTLEVTVTGVAEANDTPLTVTFFIEKGLKNVKLYHTKDGTTTGMTAKSSEADVAADKDFYYNSKTGKVTMMSKSFSPFTYVFDSKTTVDRSGVVYPAGVTTSSFGSATSVYYYYDPGTGSPFEVKTATTKEELNKYPAVVAYVGGDGEVQYASDISTAIAKGATTIYCKENAEVKMRVSNTTSPQVHTISKDQTLTIYGNGAKLDRFDIKGDVGTVNLKIYDTKSVYVLGENTKQGNTVNVSLENCHNVGESAIGQAGRMFYSSDTKATTNLSLNNCSITKAEAPVYMKGNGSVTLENCSFSECASDVKISHKATGTCNVTIKNTTFDKCGCTSEMEPNGPTYLTEDSSSIKCKTNGTMTLTLDDVAITRVVGNHSIVVDGDKDYTGTTTVDATKVTVDGTAWTK